MCSLQLPRPLLTLPGPQATVGGPGADFLAFLKRLARGYRGPDLNVILDNSLDHEDSAVKDGVCAPRAMPL